MKNFRKSIIALATAAAMLIPSVAMAAVSYDDNAATVTTAVESAKIAAADNVYVGFYEGEVLKKVAKTTVDKATVTDANPQGEEAELPATVIITDESTDEEAADAPGVEVRKLVFTAKAPGRTMKSFGIAFSYDNTKVVTVVPETLKDWDSSEWEENWDDEDPECRPYTLCTNAPYYNKSGTLKKTTLTPTNPSVRATVGNRDAMNIGQYTTNAILLDDDLVLCEIYYRTLDGAEKAANDTFKIETEIGPGTINELIGFQNNEFGVAIKGPEGNMTYAGWSYGEKIEDSIKLVTPWATTEPVGPAMTNLEVVVDGVTAADNYDVKMFIWDADQIAKIAPIEF